jgi:hypothetical protein
LGVFCLQAGEPIPNEANIVASLKRMISIARKDFQEKRLNISPVSPDKYDINVKIDDLNDLNIITKKLNFACKRIDGYQTEAYWCSTSASKTEDVSLTFVKKEDYFLLNSGLMYGKSKL